MKIILKLSVSLAVVAVLALFFVPMDSASALGPPSCPPNHCPDDLSGYTYVSTCASDSPGLPCLGWIYKKGGEVCHVAALGAGE